MKYFDLTVRVRYAETDQMGVVYYSNYFVWFEMARTEYFRALGLPYRTFEAKGIFLPVVDAQCAYKHALHYDDLVTVRTCVHSLKRSSLSFHYQVMHAPLGDVVAQGTTTHVFTTRGDTGMKACRVPPEIISVVETANLF